MTKGLRSAHRHLQPHPVNEGAGSSLFAENSDNKLLFLTLVKVQGAAEDMPQEFVAKKPGFSGKLREDQFCSFDLLHFLWLQELSDQAGSEFENSDVRWVITVPAIWKQPAKQFMRQAAYQVSAGLGWVGAQDAHGGSRHPTQLSPSIHRPPQEAARGRPQPGGQEPSHSSASPRARIRGLMDEGRGWIRFSFWLYSFPGLVVQACLSEVKGCLSE